MPLAERKRIAATENLTVGEFEENVTLFFALEEQDDVQADDADAAGEAELAAAAALAADEAALADTTILSRHKAALRAIASVYAVEEEEEEEEEEEGIVGLTHEMSTASITTVTAMTAAVEEEGKQGAQEVQEEQREIDLFLPTDVIIANILPFLGIEFSLLSLPTLSSSWHWLFTAKGFIIYKHYTARRFPKLAIPRQLASDHLRWLQKRPHPLPHGVYVIKQAHIKQITRDMWTDTTSLPPGQILQSVWYRYFLFLEGESKCGYLQSVRSLPEVLPMFRRWYRTRNDRKVVHASKSSEEVSTANVDFFSRGNLRVEVEMAHADIFFELVVHKVLPGLGGVEGGGGRCYNKFLEWKKHYSVAKRYSDEGISFEVPRVVGEGEEGGFWWKGDAGL
jgi:hypothetical protein